jgi:hypothetical protein
MNMQNLAALAAMAGNGNTSGIPSLSGTGKLIFNPFSFIRQFATQNAAFVVFLTFHYALHAEHLTKNPHCRTIFVKFS